MKKLCLALLVCVAFACSNDETTAENLYQIVDVEARKPDAKDQGEFLPINFVSDYYEIPMGGPAYFEFPMFLEYYLSSPTFGYDYTVTFRPDWPNIPLKSDLPMEVFLDIRPLPNTGIGIITYQIPDGQSLLIDMPMNAGRKHFEWKVRVVLDNQATWSAFDWNYFNLIQ